MTIQRTQRAQDQDQTTVLGIETLLREVQRPLQQRLSRCLLPTSHVEAGEIAEALDQQERFDARRCLQYPVRALQEDCRLGLPSLQDVETPKVEEDSGHTRVCPSQHPDAEGQSFSVAALGLVVLPADEAG